MKRAMEWAAQSPGKIKVEWGSDPAGSDLTTSLAAASLHAKGGASMYKNIIPVCFTLVALAITVHAVLVQAGPVAPCPGVAICSIYDSPGNIYLQAVTDSGKVYFSSSFGTSWTHQGNIGDFGFVAICSVVDSPGNIYLSAVTVLGETYFSSNFGVNWTYRGNVGSMFPIMGMCSIHDSPGNNYLQAIDDHGDVYFTDRFGDNWYFKGNICGNSQAGAEPPREKEKETTWGEVKIQFR